MVTTITPDRWEAARFAVRDIGDRFTDMVASAPEPHAKATEEWSVADVAAHVTTIASLYTALVRSEDAALPIPAVEDVVPATSVDTVDRLNEVAMAEFTERDPEALRERLRSEIDLLLHLTENLDPTMPVRWLGGSRVPVAGVVAHLINELLIHGHDISRATGDRWEIPSRDASLFIDLFIMGVLHNDVGRLLETEGPPREGRIAVEFRSRYTVPVTMVLCDGEVWGEEPGGDTDVRLSFDPAALVLMLFGRIGKPRAVLTGKVVIRGRRPWLLPAVLRKFRMP